MDSDQNDAESNKSNESDKELESQESIEDAEPVVVVKKRGRPKKNLDEYASSSKENRKNRKKSLSIDSSLKEPLEVDHYEVEDIIDFFIENKTKYFLIRWKGWDSSSDSWAKEKSLNCPDLIAAFYEKCPEAAVPTVKYKGYLGVDSEYEVSSDNSEIDLSSIKKCRKSLCPKTRKRPNGTSYNETSDDEWDTEESEPENKKKRPDSSEKKLVGRPRKDDPIEDEDEENYEVEDIIDFKIEDGIKYFLIRWKGYDSSDDSWEKLRSLNCTDLIAKFYVEHPEARVSAKRTQEDHTPDGYVTSSSSDTDNSSVSSNEYEPTTDAESEKSSDPLRKKNSVSQKKRKSVGQKRKGTSTSKVKRSVGRPSKKTLSEAKKSPGRPKKKLNDRSKKSGPVNKKGKKSVRKTRNNRTSDEESEEESGEEPEERAKSTEESEADSESEAKDSPMKKSPGRPKKKLNDRSKKSGPVNKKGKKSVRKTRNNRTSDEESEEEAGEESEERAKSTEESEADSESEAKDSQPKVKRSRGRPRK